MMSEQKNIMQTQKDEPLFVSSHKRKSSSNKDNKKANETKI